MKQAVREVAEEGGIKALAAELKDWQLSNDGGILAEWRHRYAPGVLHHTEHVFSLQVPAARPVTMAAGEHRKYCRLPWREAPGRRFSCSNRDAILMLPEGMAGSGR